MQKKTNRFFLNSRPVYPLKSIIFAIHKKDITFYFILQYNTLTIVYF